MNEKKIAVWLTTNGLFSNFYPKETRNSKYSIIKILMMYKKIYYDTKDY